MRGKLICIFSGLFILAISDLLAQNRVLINSSFESPFTPTLEHSTSKFLHAANSPTPEVKGWYTTATDYQIEIWHDGKDGVKAHAGLGKQWAELNANQISRLYENICLVKGEVLKWSFFHRGRSSTTVPDELELNLYNLAGEKVATLQKASTTSHEWKEYTGNYKVDFASGVYSLSFEAIRTASGNSTEGNFLDGITVSLSPLVQFSQSTYTGPENSSKNAPRLILNGTVPHGGTNITISIDGGTGVYREDFLFPASIHIPAGIYTPTNHLIIPLSIMNDNIPEEDETINLRLVSATGGVRVMDADCDGTNYQTAIYTILDDDSTNRQFITKPNNPKPPAETTVVKKSPPTETAVFNNKKISTLDTVNLNILFEQGNDIIVKSSEPELQELLKFLRKNSSAEIELEGHTEKDEPGYTKRQKEQNLILSERRVRRIKSVLIGQGIDGSRIKTVAYGGTRPVSDDPAKNRRVVMKLLRL